MAQRNLNTLVYADTMYGRDAPIIPSGLHSKLMEPRWHGLDPDALDDGVNPFHTVYTSSKQQSTLAAEQERHTKLISGHFVLLSNILQLEELEKKGLASPTTWPHLKRTLIGYYFLSVQ